MVRDISRDLWLRVFILGGSSQASHIPVVQYLPYGSAANFSPTDSLKIQKERHGNSNLRGVKIIKIIPRSPSLLKKYKVQSEREWTLVRFNVH